MLLLAGCVRGGSAPKGSPASGDVGMAPTATVQSAPLPRAAKVGAPASGAYLGAYDPPAPFSISAIRGFETAVGKPVSIVMWYQPWQQGNRNLLDSAALVAVWQAGKVPMITWEPWDPGTNAKLLKQPANQPNYRLSNIIAGRYDDYIRSWAVQIRDLGGPVMLRPMHEMDGNWYPWSGTANGNKPAEYVRAWRHIHDIFDAAGATNVTWVWSINHNSVPNTPANSFSAYYPGDQYVDWTAVSGFNFGTSSPYSQWRSFDFWYGEPLGYLDTIDKPICLAEIGCVEQGGDKAAWLTDAFKRIGADKKIKAVVYYNAAEYYPSMVQDFRITTSTRSQLAFRAAVAPGYFRSGAPPELSGWSGNLTSSEWQRLIAIQPVY
jgi:beta-mannanase